MRLELVCWVNGALVPLEQASVSVLDQGFRTGTGVFETLRAYGDHTFRLDAHLQRAAAGAARLDFALPPQQLLADAVRTTVDHNRRILDAAGDHDDLAVRLTLTPGPMDPWSDWPLDPTGEATVVVSAHPLRNTPGRVARAITVPWTREVPEIKSVSYLTAMLARAEATRRGVDEALLLDGDRLTEGAASSLFLVRDGRVETPALDAGLLAGVTRQVVIDVAPAVAGKVHETRPTLDALLGADEAFLTASTREITPLIEVDGHPIGDGRPGPVTAAVHEEVRQEVRREQATASG